MSESFQGTLMTILVFVVLFFVFRELNCWYFKVNRAIELLEEIRSLLRENVARGRENWIVRISSKMRPMKYNDLHLSEEEFQTWLNDKKTDLKLAQVLAPGAARFESADSFKGEVQFPDN